MTQPPSPLELLQAGVASWLPHLQPDGTLHDPVFGCPTQYGTAYLGWCCAVLGTTAGVPDGQAHRDRAVRLLTAALAHTADPEASPHASSFDRRTLSVAGRLNHRDFTWPPILKTWQALGGEAAGLTDAIAGVDPARSFRARPPSNWAAVWLSGEWVRMREGRSAIPVERLDD